jgi:ADP-heptose:LPS heptosyltransferase
MIELPDRILIVRTGAIGDVVNALVVANAVRAERPGVEIGWVVHDLALPLVEQHPSVDRVHLWRRGCGVVAFRHFLHEIRTRRYGLTIDLQRILKSAVVARLTRSKRILGFDRARSKELSWLFRDDRIPTGPAHMHMVEQYLTFARELGLEARAPIHVLPGDEDATLWADSIVESCGQPPILLQVGASKPANRWPAERVGRLARELAELNVPVCLTGGPEDRELFREALAAVEGTPGVRDLVGATTLLELVELARRSRLYVGCDTGAMHIAAAVGRPCVALFGPADPRRTGPWGRGHRVVRPPGAPKDGGGGGGMKGITVEAVMAAAREALAD